MDNIKSGLQIVFADDDPKYQFLLINPFFYITLIVGFNKIAYTKLFYNLVYYRQVKDVKSFSIWR